MPHEQGENQNPEERDYCQEIAKHEAPVLAFDPLLDLALELGWRLRDAAPLFAPKFKFAVFVHSLTPFFDALSPHVCQVLLPPWPYRAHA